MKNEFIFDVIELDDFTPKVKGVKTIYNTDNAKSLSEWVKTKQSGVKTSYPHLTSATKVADVTSCVYYQDSIGYVQNKSNNVYENSTGVSFLSAPYSNAHGFVVSKENFTKSCVVFTVRKLIKKTCIN